MTDKNRQETEWGFVIIGEDGSQVPVVKKRREFMQDEFFSLDTTSLMGSWFHVIVDGNMLWQGVVVAEPQAGRYLCDIDQLEPGAERVQRLFSLDTMLGLGDEGRRILEGAFSEGTAPVVEPKVEWRFYDSQERAQQAYRDWAEQRVVPKNEKVEA